MSLLRAAGFLAFLLAAFPIHGQTAAPATAVPLILPEGLAYDPAGNLLFAESGRHVIRRVSPAGLLTTVAGTGTQGFAGDDGPATAALLDTPRALALDAAGNIYFADAHNRRLRRVDAVTGTITSVGASVDAAALAVDPAGNIFFADARAHQIRRIDAASGVLRTVAGTGIQGFSGDGGPALAANLDTPTGLALSASGDLLLADTHNHRVRRIAALTGIISTITASAMLPGGLVLDASGDVLVADAGLQQILRIAPNGVANVIAGSGRQSFAGDGSPAPAAALDSPQTVTLSPAGLVTLADTANGRIRQVDSAGNIHTLAGIGLGSTAGLSLAAPSVLLYGTGSITATLATSPASGTVTLFDSQSQATPQAVGSTALVSNAAHFSAASLAAGPHRLFATYSGDPLHPSAQSAAIPLTITPAAATAMPASFATLYGQAIPALNGTLLGVLPQDASTVVLALASTATPLSPPGAYPITASLTGQAAGNYSLTATAAAITIAKAPTVAALDTTQTPAIVVHVASSTSGLPTGPVTLLDGASPVASATLSAGAATFNVASLAAGSHILTASYGGDADFLPVLSSPGTVVVGPANLPDFSLTASGPSSVTIPAGTAAQYSFTVSPTSGSLASPILLAASGLPPGATASFNPAYLPPSNAPATFVLTVATPKALLTRELPPYALALLLPLALLARRRRGRALGLLAASLLLGCGDRINNTAAPAATTAYTITVTATATQSTGAVLQHTATVTLNLQR